MSLRKENKEADQSTANVFVTALAALSDKARRLVIMELLEDKSLREEVEAALLWEARKDEPRRPFREYLAENKANRH